MRIHVAKPRAGQKQNHIHMPEERGEWHQNVIHIAIRGIQRKTGGINSKNGAVSQYRGCKGSTKTAEAPIRDIIRSKTAAESEVKGGISSIRLPSQESTTKCKEHARKMHRLTQQQGSGIAIQRVQKQEKGSGNGNQRQQKQQKGSRISNRRLHRHHKASEARKYIKMEGKIQGK